MESHYVTSTYLQFLYRYPLQVHVNSQEPRTKTSTMEYGSELTIPQSVAWTIVCLNAFCITQDPFVAPLIPLEVAVSHTPTVQPFPFVANKTVLPVLKGSACSKTVSPAVIS